MAGSHNNGGMAGGRMYLLEGSWDPIDPLIGGPPGIPGSPCPAEPNVLPAAELAEEPTPELGTDVDPTLAWPETLALGSTCRGCPA
jgi:hypothetical protein